MITLSAEHLDGRGDDVEKCSPKLGSDVHAV